MISVLAQRHLTEYLFVCCHSNVSPPFWNQVKAVGRRRGEGVAVQAQRKNAESMITNGREPRSCLGRVFNCKLVSFTDNTKNGQHANGRF